MDGSGCPGLTRCLDWSIAVGYPDTFDFDSSLEGSGTKWDVIILRQHGILLEIHQLLTSLECCVSADPPSLEYQDKSRRNQHKRLRYLSVRLLQVMARLLVRSGVPKPVKISYQCVIPKVVFLEARAYAHQGQLHPQGPVSPNRHVRILMLNVSTNALSWLID